MIFAAVGFYWAAGGTALLETIGAKNQRQAETREADFVAVLWVTNVTKLVAAALALALVRPFGERWPRRPLIVLLGVGGVLLALYEMAELVQHLLMAVGAIDRSGLDDTAVYGHVLLWDPWWILGACLFALAAWRSHQAERVAAGS